GRVFLRFRAYSCFAFHLIFRGTGRAGRAEILCRVFNSFLPLLEEWDEERANDTNSYDQPETRYARTGEVFHESHDVGTKKSSEKPYSVDKCKPRGQPHSGKPRSRIGKENWL